MSGSRSLQVGTEFGGGRGGGGVRGGRGGGGCEMVKSFGEGSPDKLQNKNYVSYVLNISTESEINV